MPDKLTDNEIVKELQGIKESMKRHIDLTNEMGQDLLRIDEEYTGGSKVWLTTDYFQKVVKHFSHSNYLVKCLELVFDYINHLQAENERLRNAYKQCAFERDAYIEIENTAIAEAKSEAKAEAVKEFAEKLKKSIKKSVDDAWHSDGNGIYDAECVLDDIDNLLKELVGDSNEVHNSAPTEN